MAFEMKIALTKRRFTYFVSVFRVRYTRRAVLASSHSADGLPPTAVFSDMRHVIVSFDSQFAARTLQKRTQTKPLEVHRVVKAVPSLQSSISLQHGGMRHFVALLECGARKSRTRICKSISGDMQGIRASPVLYATDTRGIPTFLRHPSTYTLCCLGTRGCRDSPFLMQGCSANLPSTCAESARVQFARA